VIVTLVFDRISMVSPTYLARRRNQLHCLELLCYVFEIYLLISVSLCKRSGKFFLTATSIIFSARKYTKVNEVCNEMLSVVVYSSISNCRRPR